MSNVQRSTPDKRADGSRRPEFEIQVEDGCGLLLLRPRIFFGWLRAERLELKIPQVTFPLDITGGMAQFQKQRCRLLGATLALDESGGAALLAERAPLLSRAGFFDLRLQLRAGLAQLSGLARIGGQSAEFVAQLCARLTDRSLRLSLTSVRLFGPLRRPAPLIAHDLLCVLLGAAPAGADDTDAPVAAGLAEVRLRPLDLFLTRALPGAGWRLPEADDVRVTGAELKEGRIELRYGTTDGAPVQSLGGDDQLDGSDACAAGDQALLRNDLSGAAAAYRLALARHPDRARPLTDRLLAVLGAREGSLREAEDLARDSLARWPDFLPARAALAAAANARGRPADAAVEYAALFELARAGGDEELAVRAALAAARGHADDDPAVSQLYEAVLALRPDHAEARDALLSRYTTEQRWPDVRRLFEAQLAAAADAPAQAAAHARLGELHFGKLGDARSARGSLEEAVRLDPNEPRAWDLLGRVLSTLQELAPAQAALEQLARLQEGRGDTPAQARTTVRLAALAENMGDDAGAQAYYRRALELEPGDAAVMEKSALLALRRGDAAEAIDAFSRLLATGDPHDPRRRRAEHELLGLLLEGGDLAAARQALSVARFDPAPESLVQLAGLEQRAGHLAEAVDALFAAARRLTGARAAELELERSRLCRTLGRNDDALAAAARVVELAPDEPVAQEAALQLATAARERGDVSDEGRWLDRLLAAGGDALPDRGALALRRSALLFGAGDAAGAALRLEEARAGGADPAAIRRLQAEILGALGDAAGRAGALAELADEAKEPAERVVLLTAVALAKLAAGDPLAALAAARQAHALAPTDLAATAALAEVAWQNRAWDEVIALYEPMLDGSAGAGAPPRAEIGRRLAVGLERVGRTQEALAAYENSVAEPAHHGETLAVAWRRLAELHERLGGYSRAVHAFAAAAGDARTDEPPAARAELHQRAAELLHRRLGATDEAIARLEEALRVDPTHLGSLDALEAIHSERGDDAQVAAALQRKLAAIGDQPERVEEILSRLIALQGVVAGPPEAARRAHQLALQANPRFLPSLRYLADDALAIGDLTSAERWFRQLAEPGPEQAPTPAHERLHALSVLASLALAEGRAVEADQRLATALELADDGEQHRELAERRIRVQLVALADPPAALAACHIALDRAPTNPALLRLLYEASRAADLPREQSDALLRLVEVTSAPAARAELLLEAAELHRSRLGEPARALELYQQLPAELDGAALMALAQRAPDDGLAARLARRAAEQTRDGVARREALRLAGERARRAGGAVEEEHLVALRQRGHAEVSELARLGKLFESTGRLGEAAQTLGEALGARVRELEAAGRSLDGVCRQLLANLQGSAAASQSFAALVGGLEAAARIEPEPSTAASWLCEAALLRRANLGDPGGAAESLERALRLRPADPGIVTDLEALLKQLKDWPRLLTTYETHLAALQGDDRTPLLLKLGRLWADTFGDPTRADAYFGEARSHEQATRPRAAPAPGTAGPPTGVQRLTSLMRAVSDSEPPAAAPPTSPPPARVAGTRATAAPGRGATPPPPPQPRRATASGVGAPAAKKAAAPPAAAAPDASPPKSAAPVAAPAAAKKKSDAAAPAAPSKKGAGAPASTPAAASKKSAAAPAGAKRRGAAEPPAADDRSAAEPPVRSPGGAPPPGPEDPPLAPLDEEQVSPATLAALEAELARLPPQEVRQIRTLRQRLGELYVRAGDDIAARGAYEQLIEDEPTSLPALDALAGLYLRSGEWALAAEIVERLSHLTTAPTQRATLLFRAGEIYRVHLGDEERASDAYLQASDLDPRHLPTLRRLIDHFWVARDDGALGEISELLDGEGGLVAAETEPLTLARVALVSARRDARERTDRLVAALGEAASAGVHALAAALVEYVARGTAPKAAAVELTQLLGGAGGPALAAVRSELFELGRTDAHAAALVAAL